MSGDTPYPFGMTRRDIDADPFGLDPFDRSRPRALDTLGLIAERRLVTRLDRDKGRRVWKTHGGPVGWFEPLCANAELFWRAGFLDVYEELIEGWELVELTEVGELVMLLWVAQNNADNARERGTLSHRAVAALPEILWWLHDAAEGDRFPIKPSLEQTVEVLAEATGVKNPWVYEAELNAKPREVDKPSQLG